MTSRSKKEKEPVELIPHLTENSSNLLTDTKPQYNNLTKTSPPRKPAPLIDSSSQDTQVKNSPKSRRSISTKKSFKEDSLIKQSTLQRKGTTLSKNPSPYIKEDIDSNYSDDTIEGEGFYLPRHLLRQPDADIRQGERLHCLRSVRERMPAAPAHHRKPQARCQAV